MERYEGAVLGTVGLLVAEPMAAVEAPRTMAPPATAGRVRRAAAGAAVAVLMALVAMSHPTDLPVERPVAPMGSRVPAMTRMV